MWFSRKGLGSMFVKLDERIAKALEETGLPYSVENGSRHWKLVVAGRLVGIASKGKVRDRKRVTLNVVAQIRRVASEVKGEGNA